MESLQPHNPPPVIEPGESMPRVVQEFYERVFRRREERLRREQEARQAEDRE
jgi:hypothetical protein